MAQYADFHQWLFDLMANGEYIITIGGSMGDVWATLDRGKTRVAETYNDETASDAEAELMRMYPIHRDE